jgi:putative ABC transport system permease protein
MTRDARRPRSARRLLGADPQADVRDELQFHVDAKVDDLIAAGWPPDEARQEAERQFGDRLSVQAIGERIGGTMERRRRVSDYGHECLQDLRFAYRTFLRERGFAIVAILVLALAIGANVATFSVVDTLLLRPLPFADAQELTWIAPPPAPCGLSCATYSADAYEEFRDQSRVYQGVTGYFAFSGADNTRLERDGDSTPATGLFVIANFFQVLGVPPALGRTFTADDARTGARPVTVLSHAYWTRQFAADASIVGRTIALNGQSTTVIGVLPASFDFGSVFRPGARVDLFTPLPLDQARTMGNIVTLVGRLRPDVTLAQARDDATRVAPDLYFNVKVPATKGNYRDGLVPVPLKTHVSGQWHRPLVVLWCAVGLVLLIACVNLANLLLVRAAARSREFAMRRALGATRARLVRQSLTESLALSGAGAVLGLAGAFALVRWLAHRADLDLPLLTGLTIDGAAVAWTVVVAVLAAAIFGTVPGLRMAGEDVQEALKDSGPAAGRGRRHERLRVGLVISEIALACVLLVGAGLLLRSFLNVLDVDLGFAPGQAATMAVDFDGGTGSAAQRAATRGASLRQIIDRVSAVPGVESAGISDYLPLGPNRSWGAPVPKGKVVRPGDIVPSPLVYVVTPGFMRAMGIHLRGRDFTWTDTLGAEPVVIINASAAHAYWPGEDAIGQYLTRDGTNLRVIGVADDVREETVEDGAGWQTYYPATQESPAGARLVVRSPLPTDAIGASVLAALRELNPRQPAAPLQPLDRLVSHSVSPRRFFMVLVAAMAGLGLLLAGLGIHGVIAYSVARQSRDIGLRMALGASTGRVRRDVLLATLRVALAGMAAGIGASLAASRLIASLLYDTSPWDGSTYLGMAAVFLAVALISGYLPARRASRIDPIVALKST